MDTAVEDQTNNATIPKIASPTHYQLSYSNSYKSVKINTRAVPSYCVTYLWRAWFRHYTVATYAHMLEIACGTVNKQQNTGMKWKLQQTQKVQQCLLMSLLSLISSLLLLQLSLSPSLLSSLSSLRLLLHEGRLMICVLYNVYFVKKSQS